MTLIVAMVAPEYVALASDRRVSWRTNSVVMRWEDRENKAIVVAGQFLVGYTGLAELRGTPTDRWFLDAMGKITDGFFFDGIGDQLQAELARASRNGKTPGHAFLAAGYGSRGSAEIPVLPTVYTISNALTPAGKWKPRRDVTVTRDKLESGADDFWVRTVGRTPTQNARNAAEDAIRRARKRDKTRVLGVLNALVWLIRQTAKDDIAVGPDASVSVLPRSAYGQQQVAAPRSGIVDPVTEITCMFVPADRDDVTLADIYTPALWVDNGMAFWGGETWYGRPPPWWPDDDA